MSATNVTMDNFQTDVVDASAQQPVVLLFWAEQVPESVQVKTLVEQVMAVPVYCYLLGSLHYPRPSESQRRFQKFS